MLLGCARRSNGGARSRRSENATHATRTPTKVEPQPWSLVRSGAWTWRNVPAGSQLHRVRRRHRRRRLLRASRLASLRRRRAACVHTQDSFPVRRCHAPSTYFGSCGIAGHNVNVSCLVNENRNPSRFGATGVSMKLAGVIQITAVARRPYTFALALHHCRQTDPDRRVQRGQESSQDLDEWTPPQSWGERRHANHTKRDSTHTAQIPSLVEVPLAHTRRRGTCDLVSQHSTSAPSI